ncbi:MAG: hypothetical protein LBB88_06065 [Planctomycetaceae bacterium]|jgi:hypothetical protein|nr:hypothetical protein [Planctomycetaceae bacterium]
MKIIEEKLRAHNIHEMEKIKDEIINNRLENDDEIVRALINAGLIAQLGDEKFLSDIVDYIDTKYGVKKLPNIMLDYCLKGIREAKNYSFPEFVFAMAAMQSFHFIWEKYKDKVKEIRDFLDEWTDTTMKLELDEKSVEHYLKVYQDYGIKKGFVEEEPEINDENLEDEDEEDEDDLYDDIELYDEDEDYEYDEDEDDDDFEDDDEYDDDEYEEEEYDEDNDNNDSDGNLVLGVIHIRPTGSMLPIIWAMCSCHRMMPMLEVPPSGIIEIAGNVIKFKTSRKKYKITLIENEENTLTIKKLQIAGIPFTVSDNPRSWNVNLGIFPKENIKEILKKPLIANLNCGIQLKFSL